MFSNPSNRALSFFITAFAAVIIIILGAFLYFGSAQLLHWKFILPLVILSLLLMYFITTYLLNKFVFDRIRVIYTYIQGSKKTDADQYKKKSLDDVNTEVLTWAKSTNEKLNSLKSLEEYRKNFVGNISHELKTPIFSIQGYLHTLLDGGLYDENVNSLYLERAARNADRLQGIVEDLEEIGRLESGKFDLNLQKFDFLSLVHEVFGDLEMKAKKKKITLAFIGDETKKYMVEADINAIRHVLNNLLVNSIKYGKDGGKTEIIVHPLDKTFLFEVKDNGLGIAEEHLKHIFDRFYRVDESRSRKQGGSGLGLSIVKHMLEAHGQTIKVQSIVDEGSSFWFALDKG